MGARLVTESRVGRVQTVGGLIDPGDLGVTLAHEHIFVDLRKTHLPGVQWLIRDDRIVREPAVDEIPATEMARWEARLDASNLAAAQAFEPIGDNYFLADEAVAVQELAAFKRLGGGAVMDVTSIGLKRDPLAVRRVAEATGLHIVLGTGHYQRVYHPEDMHLRTLEELTATIIAEVDEGIHDGRTQTEVRAGLIGEIGINGDPLITDERKAMRAAARASRRTGAGIVIHVGGVGPEKHEVLDIVADEDVDLGRVVLGHSDLIAGDVPFMLELLARGPLISFDVLGQDPSVLDTSNSEVVAAGILRLLEAGLEDRIVLSHDVCWKTGLRMWGGPGYTWILERFLPRLRELGVAQSSVDAFMVANPARLLTFEAPRP